MAENEIKELLANIETGVKSTGEQVKSTSEKVEGVTKEVNDLKTRLNDFEAKSKNFNRTPIVEVKDLSTFDGQKQARLWKAEILAKRDGISTVKAMESIYGKKDKKFVEEFKAMTASEDGMNLINEAYFAEIVPLLYNATAVVQLGARKVPMPGGNLNVRKMISGTTGSYQGEGSAAAASKAKFASARLSAKKLIVKSIFSNDLLRSESFAADQMVRDDMVEQLQIAMDYYALYGAGTENTPRGIKNTDGVNAVTGTAILAGDSLYTDLIKPIKKANVKMLKPGWIFNPDVFSILYNETFNNGYNYKYRDELKAGKFHGYPYIETNQIETGTDSHGKTDIFFGDFSKFLIGEQVSLDIQTSKEASYLDENGNTRNAFDDDETVVKAMMVHDMAVLYGKAFSVGNYYTK